MKRKIINGIKFLVFLCIGAALLYYATKGIDLNEVWNEIKSANYFWIILSLLIALISHFSRAQRWRLLIEPLGYKPSLKNTFYSVMIGYTANYALPRLGEVTRCGMLNRSDKIPIDSLFGTVIVERAVDLFMSFLFLLFLLISKFSLFGDFFKNEFFKSKEDSSSGFLQNKPILLIIVGAIIIVMVTLLIFRKNLQKFNLFNKFIKILKGIGAGLSSVFKMKKRWQFVFHSVLIWTCYLFMSYVIFFSFSFTSNLGLLDAVFILVAGTVGMVMPVPGGIGAFHYFVPLALTLYGISGEDGLSFATVQHGSQTFFAILLGAISFILMYRALKFSKQNSQSENE